MLWYHYKRNDISTFSLFSMGNFNKGNKKHFFRVAIFPVLQKHLWKFGRIRNSNGLAIRGSQQQFLVLPNFHSCFYRPFHKWRLLHANEARMLFSQSMLVSNYKIDMISFLAFFLLSIRVSF